MTIGDFMKDTYKRPLIGLCALLFYFTATLLQPLPFALLHIDLNTVPAHIKILYSLGYEIMILFVIICLFYQTLKKDWLDIKINHKTYFKKTIKYYFWGLGIMMFSNLILNFLSGGIAGNEEAVQTLIDDYPIYMWISGVIIAPLLEELLFREGIHYIFKNKWLFILCSGFLFGGMHVLGNINNMIDIFYIIPYSSLGLTFAYMLYKYDNIFISMGYHFMHNGILISLQLLLMIIQ